jgi:hypothetical protein
MACFHSHWLDLRHAQDVLIIGLIAAAVFIVVSLLSKRPRRS